MLNNKFFLLSVALLAVSSSAWVVRHLPDTSAITLAFWRMFLASALMFLLSYKTILSFVPNKKIVLAGVFLGIHFALFFRAVQLTSIAEAALLGTTAPIFTEIYSFVFQKKKPVLMVLVGLFVAFVGAGTLVSQSSFGETGTLGNFFAILCSVAMALVLIIGKEVRKETPVFEYTRWLFFYASATLLFVTVGSSASSCSAASSLIAFTNASQNFCSSGAAATKRLSEVVYNWYLGEPPVNNSLPFRGDSPVIR